MSKALEALEDIKKAPEFMGCNPKYSFSTQSSTPFLEDITIVEKELEENGIKAKAFDEIKDVVDMILVYGDYEIINDKICQIINKALEVILND